MKAIIVDDEPKATTAFGLPIVTPTDALARLKIDAVVLSSDAWEGRMWDRSRPLRGAGVHIEPLYGRYTRETEPPAIAFPRPASRLTASA